MKKLFTFAKKAKSLVSLLLLLCAVGMNKGFAYDFYTNCSTGQRLYYNITDATNHYVEITCPGDPEDEDTWAGYTRPTGNITLPSSVTYNGVTYAVKAIGFAAFDGCSGLTGSLTIPTSVTLLDSWAFGNCSGFTGSLTIPNSVTTIDFNAFYGCSGFTGSLTIPNSVTTIGTSAFEDCTSFTGSLIIGNSVTTIGWMAFSGCTNLSSITVRPETPPSLGSLAFDNVPNTIPVYVPCASLAAYQTATEWNNFANYQCMDYDFSAVCTTGQTLYYNIIDANNHYVEITYPGSSTSSPWEGYTQPTGNITLPSSVTCNNVTYAVKAIGDYAFFNCSDLTGTLTIPSSVNSIGYAAFYSCSGFTGSLTIPNSMTEIGGGAFAQCSGFNGSLSLGNSVITIGLAAFQYCHFTGSLMIPNSVITIGNGAFRECTGFTGSLSIGSSVTTIGNFAFSACHGFTGSLTIPNSVTTIGMHAFQYCTGFTGSLTIGNAVTSIDRDAFLECTGFTGSLTIGNSVTMIDDEVFQHCSGFTSMTVLPETPPVLGSRVFSGVPQTIPIYVPCSSLEDYQSASGWSQFTNMQCFETLTVYDGTATNNRIPAYILYFDDFTRSQFVIPADELVEMIGTPIRSMTFYTTSQNVPYTTVSSADVYLKEVDYTTISAYEPKSSATRVYRGYFDIGSTGSGGEMTINFSTPYYYFGGNLLVGIDNTQDVGFKNIYFYGQNVSGASISGSNSSSTGTIPVEQQNFIPKITFSFIPTCEVKSLPYTYDFEEADEMECWTMLDCATYTGRDTYSEHEGEYGFRFCYNTNPPQYLISPKLKCPTGVDVSFYYKNSSDYWPETFQVGYSTTTKSPTAFTWGNEVTAQDDDHWKLYEDYFPEDTKYVAVRYNSYDKDQLYLDDFSFDFPSCPRPVNLTATDITTNSATLQWTGYQEDYDLRYRKKPFFFEDFENGLPSDWTTIDNDGDGYNWTLANYVYYHSGHWAMYSESWHSGTALTPDNWLVTPQLDLHGTMKVWLRAQDPNYLDHFAIYLSTSGNSVSDFTTVLVPETTATGEYVYYTADLSAYAGQQGYIAIRHFNCTDMYRLLVDDFGLFENLNDTGEWEMVYEIGSGYSLSVLEPITEYEWQVRGRDCDGEGTFTEWSAANSFTTDCGTFFVDAAHPFNEGFEGTDFAPACWENYSMGPYQWTRSISSSYVHSGSASAYSYYYGDNYLVLPDLEISADALAAQLTFWSYNSWPNDFTEGNNTVVLLNGGTETVLWSAETVSQEWVETTVDLSSYLGQTISLAFKYAGDNGNGWFVDDVEVSATPATVAQTIALSAGTNWFSTYLDITLDDLKAALVSAAPANTTITIKNATQSVVYSRGHWNGTLDWDVAKRYNIKVASACEIALEGMPIVPSEHPVTVVGGGMATWIGFPLGESMTLTNAFAGFAQNGDVVKSQYGNATYTRGHWNGEFSLEPGKGYLYISAENAADRVLVYPASAK